MDGPRDRPTERGKSDREKPLLYDITSMWHLKNGTNKLIYKTNRVTDVENKLMVTRGEKRERINWEIVIDVYTLLNIKYITNKDLLYSTENSSQYSVMT